MAVLARWFCFPNGTFRYSYSGIIEDILASVTQFSFAMMMGIAENHQHAVDCPGFCDFTW